MLKTNLDRFPFLQQQEGLAFGPSLLFKLFIQD